MNALLPRTVEASELQAAKAVISLELNELNFDLIESYVARGELPNFARILRDHGVTRTTAEKRYRELEPWIQWPTVYTGRPFAEHQMFRLGDCTTSSQPQIWEILESRGVTVAAVSPMNARNACRAPAFFLPDPWTDTPVTASRRVARLFKAIRNIVNDNAHQRFATADLADLAVSGATQLRLQSAPAYAALAILALRYKWARAIVLDRMLADLFVNLWRTSRPSYASLFLNAGAHIQHHHLFDSAAYEGDQRNPDWYASRGDVDPLLTVYRAYDRIIADLRRHIPARLMITTGLSQQANPKPFFQYRPIRHSDLMAEFGLEPTRILPRMSRDFSLFFGSKSTADAAADRLASIRIDGGSLMKVERRGEELFCQIGYRGPPEALKGVIFDGRVLDLSEEITLVSIENAIHRTTGYHIDCGLSRADKPADEVPLGLLFSKTLALFEPQPA